MKLPKLFLSAATGCLLVGASGAAIAQAVDCEDPILNVTVDSITSTGGQTCVVKDSTILGDVAIDNSVVTTFVDNTVQGQLAIVGGGRATVVANSLLNVDLPNRVNSQDLSVVGFNLVIGDLKVNNNLAATVDENVVGGDLQCIGNAELDSTGNNVAGEEDCTEVGGP